MQAKGNAANMMVCWTPGTADVALVPWPDSTMQSHRYAMSSLACREDVRNGNAEYRESMVFILAMTMIVRDKCPAEVVHETLLGLAEYQQGCPDDMPGIIR